jgi:asparagine synthase (glutamine-hydrolysing)
MAEDLRRAAELLSPSIHGFTLSFEGSKDSPELTRAAQDLPYARALSRHLRVPIQEVSGTDVPLEWFAEAVSFYFDFPGYPNETMCLGLRKAAKDAGCRVLVTGSGGDQWLSGSRLYYAEELAAAKWRTLWELWSLDRRQFGVGPAITYLVRQGILPLAPRALLNGLRALRSVTQRKSVESRPWLSPRGREILEERRAATGRASEALAARPPRERALLLQLADPFTAFARELEDRAAARLQLELRHPFWSPELAQYVFLMPERLRLRGHEDRYLHRRALRGLLPARITSRRTKGEFSIAFSRVLAQVGCEPIAAIARRRPDWISPSGPSSLAELARDPNDPVGAMWAIWQAICCDMIATAAGIDGPDEATWTGGTR